MKDRPIMCVTEVLDDETGIWADDICEVNINASAIEKILKDYGKEGYNEIVSMLDLLRKELDDIWKDINGK